MPYKDLVCQNPQCRRIFTPRSGRQRFCDEKCRTRAEKLGLSRKRGKYPFSEKTDEIPVASFKAPFFKKGVCS